MNIGVRIRSVRKNKGFSQIEVAEKAQIAVNSLRNYEAGKRQPNMEQLQAIATALEVSLSELLWIGDGPAPEPLHVVATPQGSYIVTDRDEDKPAISDEDIKFALFGGKGEITDDMLDEVRTFAEFVRQREEAKKKPPQD